MANDCGNILANVCVYYIESGLCMQWPASPGSSAPLANVANIWYIHWKLFIIV